MLDTTRDILIEAPRDELTDEMTDELMVFVKSYPRVRWMEILLLDGLFYPGQLNYTNVVLDIESF